jgi:hypothetical protein
MSEDAVRLPAGSDVIDGMVELAANQLGSMPIPRPEEETEVGHSFYLPFLQEFKNSWEIPREEDISVKKLVAMRQSDGQAQALYRLLTRPIQAALKSSTFVPSDLYPGGEKEAEFIRQMFTLPASNGGMMTPLPLIVSQMLRAVFDGFSPFELVYWTPTKGPLKGKITLKKIAYRPAETIKFLIDRSGNFEGFRQQTYFNGEMIDVKIDKDDAIYYTANEDERPFYGQSYFKAAFFHYDKKAKLYWLLHVAAQRAAMGTRVGTIPKNANVVEKNRFLKALADVGLAQYIAVPDGYAVESLKEAGSFDFLQYINHHNSQMSKSILAPFFDTEQGSGGDSSLVDFGKQDDSLFMLMLQTIMREVADVINNQIIPRFIDWNFNSGKYPTFQWGPLTDEQKGAMKTTFDKLSTAGQTLTISPEFVWELEKQMAEELGLEIDWTEIDAEREEQKELAKQAQMAQLAAMQPQDPNAPVDPNAVPEEGTGTPVGVPTAALPEGFQLTAVMPEMVELARKVASQGGVNRYNKPIGTVIGEGATGLVGAPKPSDAKVPSPVSPDAKEAPQGGPGVMMVLRHPHHEGAKVLVYGDGTVSVQDSSGNISRRQKFDPSQFVAAGWGLPDGEESDAGKQPAKPSKK